jgi:hypothetical protein
LVIPSTTDGISRGVSNGKDFTRIKGISPSPARQTMNRLVPTKFGFSHIIESHKLPELDWTDPSPPFEQSIKVILAQMHTFRDFIQGRLGFEVVFDEFRFFN